MPEGIGGLAGRRPAKADSACRHQAYAVQAYKIMPDSVMFRVQEVKVELTPFDLPSPSRRKVTCSRCGQVVRDHRELERDGGVLCKSCAGVAYFTDAQEFVFPEMNWSPYAIEKPMISESPPCQARVGGEAMRKAR